MNVMLLDSGEDVKCVCTMEEVEGERHEKIGSRAGVFNVQEGRGDRDDNCGGCDGQLSQDAD